MEMNEGDTRVCDPKPTIRKRSVTRQLLYDNIVQIPISIATIEYERWILKKQN